MLWFAWMVSDVPSVLCIVTCTGLPGISIPASARAVSFRRDCDLLVVHSRREREEFTRLASATAPGLAVALGGLPFLTRDLAERPDLPADGDVVELHTR